MKSVHDAKPRDGQRLFGESQHPEASTPQKKPTILLAEDDADLRALIRIFLVSEGYEVIACSDGQRALSIAQAPGEIDLLIADLEMPQLKGTELADVLSERRHDLSVILISGTDVSVEQEKQFRARGWLFLSKPFGFPALLAAVHARVDYARCLAATA